MLDQQTGEKFYYNDTSGAAQWEVPNEWNISKQNQQTEQHVAGLNTTQATKHAKRWEPITTPKGKICITTIGTLDIANGKNQMI